MKTITLPPDTRRETGATHKAIIDFNDLIALGANATGNLSILQKAGVAIQVPAGTRFRLIGSHLVTPFVFSDGAMTGLTVTVGDAGSNNRHLASQQLATVGTPVTDQLGTAGEYLYTAATQVNAYFTGAGGASPTLAEATAGKVEIAYALLPTDLTRPQ